MRKVAFDFETRSRCDLRRCGAYKYSLDPTTRPTCLAFKLSGEPRVYFLDFKAIARKWKDQPQALRDMWTAWILEGNLFTAHNAFFEKCVYTNIMVKRYGWPLIPDRQYRCTAAKAAACALPRNLEGAGAAMALTTQKDKRGYVAMMATCKPMRKWNDWVKARDKVKAGKKVNAKTLALAESEEPPVFLEPEVGPGVFETLYTYCKIDVRTEELLDESLPDLVTDEQQIWHFNQLLNWRGLHIDIPIVKKIVAIMDVESKKKIKELDKLTMGLITKPGARQSIIDFLAMEGVEVPNLQAKTVTDKLGSFDLNETTRRLLEIRKALSLTSTKKYQSFLDRAYSDDRVRDILLYHGASTGRDTGVGVQPHNFPRGILKYKDIEWVIKLLQSEDDVAVIVDQINFYFGKDTCLMVFSSLLRSMIIPDKGHELFVADFSKIEVAVLWWLADNKPGLEILHSGKDPYIYQAAANTGRLYREIENAVNREEKWALDTRQLGKAQILGCFEKNTRVLTDIGWKRIIDVSSIDKLWDGIEWVNHQGLVYQGMKNTISFLGMALTPEHLVLLPQGWTPAEVAQKENVECLKSAHVLVDLPLSAIGSAYVAALWQLKFSATVKQNLTRFMTIIFSKGRALSVIRALKKLLITGRKTTTLITDICQKTNIVKDYLTACLRPLLAATIQTTTISNTMVAVEFLSVKNGEKIRRLSYSTFRHVLGGITRNSTWTELKMKRGMSPVTFVLSRVQKICLTAAKWLTCKKESLNLRHVYDIANAGPRHRFTVLTSSGPLLVHNCGFGMGSKKFKATAWDMYRLALTEDQSKVAVDNYRHISAAVPALWKAYENAAVYAVENPGKKVRAGRCNFKVINNFLWVQLPKGRCLAYAQPSLTMRETEWGPRRTLEFMAVNSKTKKWGPERTWGGTLTENIVQAVARDLMMPAMVRLEKKGYQGLLMVHDEGICQKAKGTGSLKEFIGILCERPVWADEQLPIEAKGWIGPRYRK